MSGAFVQQTGLVSQNASFTQNLTLNGTTSGNSILIPFYHANNSFNGTTVSASDGTNTYTIDIRKDRANTYTVGIFRLFNIAGGNTTITLTASSGTAANSFWRSNAIEYSGLSGVVDTASANTAQNASSTGPVSVTSGTLSQSTGELVIAAAISESGTSGLTNASGFTGRGLGNTLSINEQFATSNSAITANCGTLSAASGWDILIQGYQVLTVAPPSSGGIFVLP